VRQLSSGDGIKIYNERGEFGAKAHVANYGAKVEVARQIFAFPAAITSATDRWVAANH